MTHSLRVSLALAFAVIAAPTSFAQGTYDFSPPNFTLGAVTPLANVPPNFGAPGLLTSFSSSPTIGGFVVGNTILNPLFSGQMLYDSVMPADSLTLMFNQPVNSISLDFAVQVPSMLRLTEGVFMVNQPSGFIGPNFDFQGGTLSYSNPAGFTSVTLAAFDLSMTPVLFGIDNAVISPVPEPATILGICALGYGTARLIRRRYKSMNDASTNNP